MKFKIDENMPSEATEDFRQAGHDAVSVIDQHLAGQSDARVADVCKAEHRAIVTLDLDFSDIRDYSPNDYAGIVVLRPAVQTITSVRRLVKQVISTLSSEVLAGHLWIVDDGQIRIRSGTLPTP